MDTDEVIRIFEEAGAFLRGHFILSSGRRSPVFFQKALIFSQPKLAERLSIALAEQVRESFGEIDVVAGPAVGGIIPSYELARQLGARAIYAERVDGVLTFRRGFSIETAERVLIAEDIVTTGLSFKETVEALRNLSGELMGGVCYLDRSGGEVDVGCKFIALASRKFPDYAPEDIPSEMLSIEPVKPGSRSLK